MANNRLYLKCKRTGQRVLVGVYMPSRGWIAWTGGQSLEDRLDAMFNNDDAGHPFDGSVHEVEYEVAEGDFFDGGKKDGS